VKTYGNKFRKERERLRFSIEDVASVTKIGTRMLKAIEDERFDQLPGGVFSKGFIRTYATHLGMNPEEAVTGYLACVKQSQLDALPAPATDPRATARPDGKKFSSAPQPRQQEELPDLQLPKAEHVRPPKRDFPAQSDGSFPWKILALATLVIGCAFFVWNRHSRYTSTAGSNPASAKTNTVVDVSAPSHSRQSSEESADRNSKNKAGNIPANAAAAKTASNVAYLQTAVSSTRSSASGSIKNSADPKQDARAGDENKQGHITEVSRNSNTPAEDARATQPILTSVSSTPSPSSLPNRDAARLTLVIRATENSWISITADGQPITHEILLANAHTSVRASHEIVVRAGNAAGVSFRFNGKEIPPQGAESEVKTLVFNATGLVGP
jgi:cytoskeletal protein RodZ